MLQSQKEPIKGLIFSKERKQGFSFKKGKKKCYIIEHPDVKRMLLEMKSQIEAMRGYSIYCRNH